MRDFYRAWLTCRSESTKINTPLVGLLAAGNEAARKALVREQRILCGPLGPSLSCSPNERSKMQSEAAFAACMN